MDDSHPGLYDRGLLSLGSDWTDRPDSRECLVCLRFTPKNSSPLDCD